MARREPESPYRYEVYSTRRGPSYRYRDQRTGRWVRETEVRSSVDRYLDTAGTAGARETTRLLREGRISLADWQIRMHRIVKDVHYASLTAAAGGVENMTAVERGRAGALIRNQLAYLKRFAAQIESGEQRLDGTADRRAEMYVQQARGSYYAQKEAGVKARRAADRLTVRSRRFRGDSCRDCVYLDGKWFYMGDPEYLPIGRRQCSANCRCTEEYGAETESGEVEVVE